MSVPNLLSTKKLSLAQRELLLNAGFRLIEYDAIQIEPLDFDAPESIEHAIFTSQNGVRFFFESASQNISITHCYCVGQKTKALLLENGQNVVKSTENSKELAEFLIKNAKNESFYYFCGSRRRDELPEMLKTNKIELFEVKTYKTSLKPKHFGQKWAGILFFSPSGVESYATTNSMEKEIAFCIGVTTAQEAKKHTQNVIVANTPRIESVIAKAAKTLKIHKP